ncbi:putative I-spannin [Serratia phage Muldoon]|uniref:Putative I-spannin n=1 Tax=Serratia phage Muldoon TaxID=2601678 RepID=A0A5P8PHP6_9CAUD|nr:Rz-like spanin [Serratia phage Muldoon]QFR56175.1 putative I-spannin [Serratia phage Muldoon]
MSVKVITGLIIAALIVGMYITINVQGNELRNLESQLSQVSKEFNDFKTSTENDLKGLKQIDENRKSDREQQKKSDAKLRNDSKRAETVAKKPGLVEKQINNSFNKLADDFTELTK